MANEIRVLVADDIKETRENIKVLLSFDERIKVIGEAENGDDVVKKAKELNPDIILMDINMPEKDGLQATEEISMVLEDCSIIIMSVEGEHNYLKKAMAVGAKEYIVKPFSCEDLVHTIIKVYENDVKRKTFLSHSKSEHRPEDSKVIMVYGTKGGVGKTTIAVNLAVSIAKITGSRVAILDLNLRFGDVAMNLNLYAKKTISDLVEEINVVDEIIEDYLIGHFSGVKVLPAPLQPQLAEYVSEEHVSRIIKQLKSRYEYVIIDSASGFEDYTMSALEMSDSILYVLTPDIFSIKNTKIGLNIISSLGFEEKIKIVINKASEQYGIRNDEIKDTLGTDIFAIIPEDNQTVISFANKGFPFVMGRYEKKISTRIVEMAEELTGGSKIVTKQKSVRARFFSL